MTELNRRELIGVFGATVAATLVWTEADLKAAGDAQQARAQSAASGQPYTPRFFTAREYAMVVALADLILPRDAKSGSASEAGAPEFVDYIVAEQPNRQTPMRGGLAWLNAECAQRFDKAFLDCSDAERRQVLDDIAWPARAAPAFSQGVAFFNQMRDLVAAGFFSSKMGVADLGYIGNRVASWDGAPAPVLQKIGVSYE